MKFNFLLGRRIFCLLLGIPGLLLASPASAADYVSTGEITLVRIHSTQIGLTSVRGVTAFKLSNQLYGRCIWLVIAADDKNTLAHFANARALAKPIAVHYTDAIMPPWGDSGSCYITVIDS